MMEIQMVKETIEISKQRDLRLTTRKRKRSDDDEECKRGEGRRK